MNSMQKVIQNADELGVRVIDVKFASYCSMVYGCLPNDLPVMQKTEVRNAFLAGMALYQGDVLGAIENEAATEAYVHRIMHELEEFASELAAAMSSEEAGK
ncbi:hypothetical protein DVVG_00037 [Dunaliella viridis virus SI2]|uniref:hypothetical protein n=1 Tax=Dunaliella viridis virus SI2 TaxID=754069 RepID=UPI0002C08BF7|nr:hypothetical protein DVVG_00037 [Dunaliella viridis virus SI2]AGH16023.1 hypothetical protein DVVG_00037 [Dunaliella viridis virus SI2]